MKFILVPQFSSTNLDLKGLADVPLNIIPNNTSAANFYANKTTSNFQNNLNLMEKIEQIPEGLRISKSISATSVRKSFNAEEYMYNLKLKLGSGEINSNKNLEFNANFANFLAKEKEFIKSQSKLNTITNNNFNSFNIKSDLGSNNDNFNVGNQTGLSNNYETFSVKMNKNNIGNSNNFFQISETNLNANNLTPSMNNFGNENNKNDIKINNENKDQIKGFSNNLSDIGNERNEKLNSYNNTMIKNNLPSTGMFTSSQLSANNSGNNFLNNNKNNFSNNLTGNSNSNQNKKSNNSSSNDKIDNYF